MQFHEKLTLLRKERGLTQEALAFEIGVSRQSVSKWELGESEPDLGNLKALAALFEVTLDYLIQSDELHSTEEAQAGRRVSLEDAEIFLELSKKNSLWLSLATLLCVLSPVCLFVLGGLSDSPYYALSENVAGGIGISVLLIFVAAAVVLFIVCDGKIAPYSYLEKESFFTEKGVLNSVHELREGYKSRYDGCNAVGTCLCILAAIPLFLGGIFEQDNDFLATCMLALTFLIAGAGVFLFVKVGVVWGSFEKLLQTGEYTKERKARKDAQTALSVAYWLLATALFLVISISTDAWKYGGIVWVVAGVLYPALLALFNGFYKKK